MRLSRLPLRSRVSAAFGLGLALMASALAVATWHLATGYMLGQREQSATRQAETNVRLVGNAITAHSGGLDELLTGLTTGPDSTILLSRPDGWLSSGRTVDTAAIPRSLVDTARAGSSAHQRLTVSGIPVLAVAMRVGEGQGVYVELYPLLELEQTFRYLKIVLVTGTVAAAVFGVVLGAWASKRALRPLTTLTSAASKVASGDLAARLPEQADPDLAPLAASFNTTADALERRVRRDIRFAADVSHELRSPLTTMVNVAQILARREASLPEPARQALRLLLAELDRFQHMVVDLLEISSSDSNGDQNRDVVDLAELVRTVAERGKRDPVPVDAEPAPVLVFGDSRRLDRIVANLLDNAHRYGSGAVRIGLWNRDGNAIVEVDDNGPGVPEPLRERIFERFARGAHSGRRSADTGAGLGLAIVAEHVRWHDGQVRVTDRPGGGARFVVTIPLAAAPGSSASRQVRPPSDDG